MHILAWVIGVISRPTTTFEEMETTDSWFPALIITSVVIELFEIIFIIAILMDQHPTTRLVFPISTEHYYLGQLIFGPFLYVIGLLVLTSLTVLLGGEADGEGEWKPMFMKLSFACAVPLIFVVWPLDLVMILGGIGFGPQDFVGRMTIAGILGLGLLWVSLLSVLAAMTEHRIYFSRALMIFIPSLLPVLIVFVMAYR